MVTHYWKKPEYIIRQVTKTTLCSALLVTVFAHHAQASQLVRYIDSEEYVPYTKLRHGSIGKLIEIKDTEEGHLEILRDKFLQCRFLVPAKTTGISLEAVELDQGEITDYEQRLFSAVVDQRRIRLLDAFDDSRVHKVRILFEQAAESTIPSEVIGSFSNSSALTDECVDLHLIEGNFLVAGTLHVDKIKFEFVSQDHVIVPLDHTLVRHLTRGGNLHGPNLKGTHSIESAKPFDLGYRPKKLRINEEIVLGGIVSQSPDLDDLRPPGISEAGYFRTHVWFATDRAIVNTPVEASFGGDRGDSLIYGRAEVSIPDTHSLGVIESPAWYRLFNRVDPTDFVVVMDIEVFADADNFAKDVKGRSDALEAMVFVHGFNVEFKEAARRAAQLAYDLGFTGVPILYSWPSFGTEAAYTKDAGSIMWTREHLRQFLGTIVSDLGVKRVHLIAHSMGNRALLEVLANMDTDEPNGAQFHQLVMAAPDVDVGVFKQLAAKFMSKVNRATLYTSSNDVAIRLSSHFNQVPRAGGTITLVDGMDTIDANNVNTSFVGHSYYGDSLLEDLFGIFKHGLAPEDRFGLAAKTLEGKVYWEFRSRVQ